MQKIRTNREVDVLIAQEIFGWTPADINRNGDPEGHWRQNKIGAGTLISPLPNFSTNIGDAWSVVEAMEEMGFQFELLRNGSRGSRRSARFWSEDKLFRQEGDSLSHAICLAALNAKGKI